MIIDKQRALLIDSAIQWSHEDKAHFFVKINACILQIPSSSLVPTARPSNPPPSSPMWARRPYTSQSWQASPHAIRGQDLTYPSSPPSPSPPPPRPSARRADNHRTSPPSSQPWWNHSGICPARPGYSAARPMASKPGRPLWRGGRTASSTTWCGCTLCLLFAVLGFWIWELRFEVWDLRFEFWDLRDEVFCAVASLGWIGWR